MWMLSNNRAAENTTKHRKLISVLKIFWILSNLCVCLVTFWVDTSLQGAGISRVSSDSCFSERVDIFRKQTHQKLGRENDISNPKTNPNEIFRFCQKTGFLIFA